MSITPHFVAALLSVIFVQQGSGQTSSLPTYTILAPSKLRPNADYHVSVSLHNIQSHVDVDIAILGQESDSGKFNTISKTVTLNSDDTRILKFEIGEWASGNYRITVVGKGDIDFRNESSINYEAKSYSVFIQTDKAIYKAGQLVQFRAIVVDPSLIPSVTGAIDIHVNVSYQIGSIHSILFPHFLGIQRKAVAPNCLFPLL
jgi:CD109 antigen